MEKKTTLTFSFSKKAEPKRVVEALKKKDEVVKETILSLEEGQLNVEAVTGPNGPLTISCKNPLLDISAKKQAQKPATAKAPPAMPGMAPDLPGGLVNRNLDKVSDADAEAVKELLKDASKMDAGDESVEAPQVVPILMRPQSKRVRDEPVPEASKDMYDNVPVESFGEAMLRGMGYDPDKHKTKPVFRDKLRDTYLGLGAKPMLPSEKMPGAKKKATPATKAADVTESGGQSAASAPAQQAEPISGGVGRTEHSTKEPSQKRQRSAGDDTWPSRGLVVRVIGQGSTLRDAFGMEAVVLDVDEASGSCRIKARVKGKSQTFESVRFSDLETRVSRDCKEVRIVRGPKKGTVAKLIKRDSEKKVAVVLIDDKQTEMSLDEVCQFMA